MAEETEDAMLAAAIAASLDQPVDPVNADAPVESGSEIPVASDAAAAPAQACYSTKTFNPPEHARAYSSVYNTERAGTGHARSMLDSEQAWSARTNEVGQYMIMDLRAITQVKGVVTQARVTCDQWVKTFTVQYSSDCFTWHDVVGTFNSATKAGSERHIVEFPEVITARYVKLVVQSWNNHISMRAGVLVDLACPDVPDDAPTELPLFTSPAANFARLEIQIVQDRASGPARVDSESPLGNSLSEFLQICLSRVDVCADTANCVQLRFTKQHNNHSCGYFALYYAKSVLDVMKARTEVAALRAAAGLANGDRSMEFAKAVHASLEQSLLAQARMQTKEAKDLFKEYEMTRSDAADTLGMHPLLQDHKSDISLICDPTKLEATDSSDMNLSVRDFDNILSDLKKGLRSFHVFVFGAGDHFYTLVVWSKPNKAPDSGTAPPTAAAVAPAGESVAAKQNTEADPKECPNDSARRSDESSTCRQFELILCDSENELNFTLDLKHPPDQKKHLVKRVPECRRFVSLVAACTGGGSTVAARQIVEATEAFLGHLRPLLGVEDKVKTSEARTLFSKPSYVQENIHHLDLLLRLSFALDTPIRLPADADHRRLLGIVRAVIETIATDIDTEQIGRSTSTLRPLPLSRTTTGSLWVSRQDGLLRSLAEKLGIDGLPKSPDWGEPIQPPSDELASSLTKGCNNAIDMDEARELLMAIAFEDGRRQVVEADMQKAARFLQDELKKRPMCTNGHTLTKAKREKSWCNNCNNGFIPKGLDPVTFLGLSKELQQEQREDKKCFIMSDYLCKQCEYFCCEKCFMARGRGTMLNACLRAVRCIVDLPDSEWRCYDDYDSFPGENAAEESAEQPASNADPKACEEALTRAVESAKAKCVDCGFGGFAIFKGKIYFRKQSTADCHVNLQPQEGVTFYVAPKIVDAAAAEREAQEAQRRQEKEAQEAQHRQKEHREKIANLKEAVLMMGLGSLTDQQTVYWLEQGSYVPENAVAMLLDAFESGSLNPPAEWTSSCGLPCCRPAEAPATTTPCQPCEPATAASVAASNDSPAEVFAAGAPAADSTTSPAAAPDAEAAVAVPAAAAPDAEAQMAAQAVAAPDAEAQVAAQTAAAPDAEVAAASPAAAAIPDVERGKQLVKELFAKYSAEGMLPSQAAARAMKEAKAAIT